MNKKAEAAITEANIDWEAKIKKLSSKEYSDKDKEKLKKTLAEYLTRIKKNPTL